MIPARPHRAFLWLFERYARRSVSRHFAAMHVRGALQPPGPPVLYVVNHSSWWDALVILLLSRSERRVGHLAMMGEAGLRRFPFFQRLGAFSVPSEAGARDLSAMRELLRYVADRAREGHHLWMFPQGERRHAELRPLGVARGAEVIASRLEGGLVVPVALRLDFLEAQHPELFISIGRATPVAELTAGRDVGVLLLEEVERLKADVMAGRMESFEMQGGAASVSDRWSRFKARWVRGGEAGS